NSQTYLDGRCAYASIVDAQDHTVCSILNLYIPPAHSEQFLFFDSLRMEVPFFLTYACSRHPPPFILGDLNSSLRDPSFQNHVFVEPWLEWLNAHYANCFPEALPTYTSAANHNTRKTIDYIFVDKSWMANTSNAQIYHLPSSWTDHSLLTVDISTLEIATGPGAWRFNPILLLDSRFAQLLTVSVDTFLSQIDFNALQISVISPPTAPPVPFVASIATKRHRVWESFKLLQNVAKSYSRHSKARSQHILSRLQFERNDLLASVSSAVFSDAAHLSRLQQLDTAIEALVEKETA
ncbi:hypothetical protein A0J61_11405, partial [Choanephora cucurbitarum]